MSGCVIGFEDAFRNTVPELVGVVEGKLYNKAVRVHNKKTYGGLKV
jgi:hypothetical protein